MKTVLIQEQQQKVKHKLSSLFLNATEQQCSGVRHLLNIKDGTKSVCAIGLIELYVSN